MLKSNHVKDYISGNIMIHKTIKCPYCGKEVINSKKDILTCPKCKRIIVKPKH